MITVQTISIRLIAEGRFSPQCMAEQVKRASAMAEGPIVDIRTTAPAGGINTVPLVEEVDEDGCITYALILSRQTEAS